MIKSKKFMYVLIGALVVLFSCYFLFFQEEPIMMDEPLSPPVDNGVDRPEIEEIVEFVEFTGEIYRDLETHYYLFSTIEDGVIDMRWGPDTLGSDYIITDANWRAMYFNGDTLPAGEYMVVITSNPTESPDDPNLLKYHFTLRGLVFKENPDTSLPELTIESPLEFVNELPKGEQTVIIKGSSNAEKIIFGSFGLEEEFSEPIKSPFEKKLYFDETSSNYSAYRISATNASGNTVNRYYEFYYAGGKKVE